MLLSQIMTRVEKQIIDDLKHGRFIITIHARNRMDERDISPHDIINVALTHKSILYQKENETFKITGKSLEDEPLIVICGYSNETLIVTTYYI